MKKKQKKIEPIEPKKKILDIGKYKNPIYVGTSIFSIKYWKNKWIDKHFPARTVMINM